MDCRLGPSESATQVPPARNARTRAWIRCADLGPSVLEDGRLTYAFVRRDHPGPQRVEMDRPRRLEAAHPVLDTLDGGLTWTHLLNDQTSDPGGPAPSTGADPRWVPGGLSWNAG